MGNAQQISTFIKELDDTSEIDISSKHVTFLEHRLQAESIYQRNNYQVFKVKDSSTSEELSLRIVPSIHNAQIENMIHILHNMISKISHPLLQKIFSIHTELYGSNLQISLLQEYVTGTSLANIKNSLINHVFTLNQYVTNLFSSFFNMLCRLLINYNL
jgi:hypothetical protein